MHVVSDRAMVLDLVEYLVSDLSHNFRIEDIRLDEKKIGVLLQVRDWVAKDSEGKNRAELTARCPDFASLFQAVFLRDLEEFEDNAAPNEGRSPS